MTIHKDGTNSYVNIEPVQAGFPAVGCPRFFIVNVNDNVFDQAVASWQLRGEDGGVYATGQYTIIGDEYENWTSNDYIYGLVLVSLGLTAI